MIVVTFNPPLERKDFESVLPRVQEMFPDWEWCSNTGTPTLRGREKIIPGILRNQNVSGYGDPIYTDKIGSLIHYGRFKHYGEPDCLAYSGGWSQVDTDSYIKQGHNVEVIDGWELIKHTPLDMDNVFNSLTETIRRVLKESEDDLGWAQDIVSQPLVYSYLKSKIGDRVVRGPNWAYAGQDYNGSYEQTVGTVRSEPELTDGEYWVDVKWDGGSQNNYEIGPNIFSLQYAIED